MACSLSGCVAAPPTCLLPSQRPLLAIDLYFGRDIVGRRPVTDTEWATFALQEITPRFPDGFTTIDAQGQWLNPQTRSIAHEATKIVRMVTTPNASTKSSIQAIEEAYRSQFHQQAVGISTSRTCAQF